MSRFRCVNCGGFFDVSEVYRSMNGMSRVCSEQCFNEKLRKKKSVKKSSVSRKVSTPVPPEVRREVMDRDGRVCRFCGGSLFLHVHHISYRSEGGPHEVWNLIVLCDTCHAKVHGNKHRWQPVLRAYIWLRYVEGRGSFIPSLFVWLKERGFVP